MSQFVYLQKQAWAGLKKQPGFVATVLTTMGVTLGALLCILTLGYVMLFEPLPYPDQDRLYQVDHNLLNKAGIAQEKSFTYPGLVHLLENQTVFSEAAAVNYHHSVMTSHPAQPSVDIAFVTSKWFGLLGAQMALGRPFSVAQDTSSDTPEAVLSFDSWQQHFAGNENIVNQKVSFRGISYKVIGVTAQSFVEPKIFQTGRATDVWLPWHFNLVSADMRSSWTSMDHRLMFVGKLTQSMSLAQAEQTLSPIINNIWRERVAGVDFFKGWQIEAKLNSFKSVIVGDSQKTVTLLLAGVIGLLLIACANIANLFMSRTAGQQRQLAIHAAVGAKKSDLFYAQFAESSQLMALSVVLALLVASGGFMVLQYYLVDLLPRVDELSVNGFTLVAAIVIVLFLAFFFARISSNMINYRALNATLQSGGKGTGIQVSKVMRQVLIVSQVSIATALVFINISLFKEAANTIATPMGFSLNNINELSLSKSKVGSFTKAERVVMINELKDGLSGLDQVVSVSQGGSPLQWFNQWKGTEASADKSYVMEVGLIDEQYFAMFEQPLLEGDNFTAANITDESKLMVINDVLAKNLAPGGSALGMHIAFSAERVYKVVGVVKGVQLPATDNVPFRAYIPVSPSETSVMIKTKNDKPLTREMVVTVLKQATNAYTVSRYQPLTKVRNEQLFTQYTTATTTSVVALLSFFLAAVGLYGIFSYSTQIRRFELGTRMAVGAKRKDLIKLVLGDNATPVVTGILVSMVILLALYLGLSDSLVSYIQIDIMVYVLTLWLIVSVSISASYLPLRQFINRPAIHSLRGSD